MFISKDQQTKIKQLNQILGMKHRSTPFDFNKKEDWIEAIEMITAEYVDFCEYWGRLSNLNSNLDESLECFYPASWVEISQEGNVKDAKLNNAIKSVNKAEDSLRVLMERAEEKCRKIWILVFESQQKAVIKEFLGEEMTCSIEDLQEILEEEIFEMATEIEYTGNVENSIREFSKNLKQKIELKKLEQ
ncbi:hypothetical protein MKY42_12705 [Paenibacillus sp. FSL W7-1088]|uniref:hypothetical protein n=1 Tax=unclassified Paenibacillus TaxID=185978 RepID=UPI0015C5F721|nr:hypothetical protein [Paenibacillus sp. E222]QLG41260.1 hypothetical protein HW560_26250 [Paenibacillus sp. E222]